MTSSLLFFTLSSPPQVEGWGLTAEAEVDGHVTANTQHHKLFSNNTHAHTFARGGKPDLTRGTLLLARSSLAPNTQTQGHTHTGRGDSRHPAFSYPPTHRGLTGSPLHLYWESSKTSRVTSVLTESWHDQICCSLVTRSMPDLFYSHGDWLYGHHDVKHLMLQPRHAEHYDAHKCHHKQFHTSFNNCMEEAWHFDSVLLHSNNTWSNKSTCNYPVLEWKWKIAAQGLVLRKNLE